jgi:hypothetical protein
LLRENQQQFRKALFQSMMQMQADCTFGACFDFILHSFQYQRASNRYEIWLISIT